MKLKIEPSRDTHFFNFWKVTGFSSEELAELHKIQDEQGYFAFKSRFVQLMDEHNPNQGTCWSAGYGIYGVYFGYGDNCDAIYVETGSSCD